MNHRTEKSNTLRLMLAVLFVAAAVPLAMWRAGSAAPENAPQSPAAPQSQGKVSENKFRRAAKPVRDRYIVVLNRDTPAEYVEAITNELLARHGGSVGYVYKHAIKGFSIQVPEAAAIALSQDPRVEYVEEDAEARLDKTVGVVNWGLDRVDQRNLPLDNNYHFANVNTGAGINVYVVDSGIQIAHTDFRNPNGSTRAVRDHDSWWWDFQNGNDCNGHGTAVAGIVGGNTFGVAKGATLHAVRVFSCENTGIASAILDGIDWVVSNRQLPAVMNMSLTIGSIDYGIEDAVRAAIASGITVVVSAGNDARDADAASPGRIPEAITVGATTDTDIRAGFSNFGPVVDLFAPGVDITSASNTDVDGNGVFDDAVTQRNGTSFAAPFVSGIAARFIQANPGVAVAAVQGAIKKSATPDIVSDPLGATNLLAYSEVHQKRAIDALIGFINESDTLRDSGLDIFSDDWLALTGGDEIWAGVLFSGTNGPEGWNSVENSTAYPLPGSRPYSLLGILDSQNFYIGTSNAATPNLSSPKRLFFRTNDDVPGNGSGAFLCHVQIWRPMPDVSADFDSQSVPATVLPGQIFPVSITMKNVGPATWTAGQEFKLAIEPDSLTWGTVRVTVPNDVLPGATVTFNFYATAPATPGNYNFQWRMIHEGFERFGDVTPNVPITVLAWSNQAQFISQSVKTAMYAGETYTVSVTMKNVGNTTWTAGSLYRLGSQNPQDNSTWGMNRVPLPYSVAPGGQVTFTFDVTAPALAATYNFQWRMVQDGVEWFGPQTPNVAVTVKLPSCLRC